MNEKRNKKNESKNYLKMESLRKAWIIMCNLIVVVYSKINSHIICVIENNAKQSTHAYSAQAINMQRNSKKKTHSNSLTSW